MIMKNGTTKSYRCVNGGFITPPSYVDSYYYCGTNYSNKDDDNRHGVRPSSSSSTSFLLSSRDLHDDDDDDANDYNDNSDHFSVPQSQASFITATIMDRCVRAFLVLILTTTGAVGIQNTLLPAMAATPTLVLSAAPAPTTITTQARTEALTTALALIDNGTILRSVSSSSFSVAVAAAESISLAGVAGTIASSSADAARLLLDTPAKQRTIPTKVRNQILKQIQQQDTRLAECEGSEDDTWEQCFYYGKKGGSASTKDTNNDAPFLTPLPPDMVGSRIPTW